MHVSDLPFNRLIGITVAADGRVALETAEVHQNHLGTVHASAIYAVAEACSGEWIIRQLAATLPDALAVTRSGTIQYKKPARSKLGAAVVKESSPPADVVQRVTERGMGRIELEVQVTSDGVLVAVATFEWMIQKGK